jgi:hypothetical protein
VWSAHLIDGKTNTNKYRGDEIPGSKDEGKKEKEDKSTAETIVEAVVEVLTAEELVYPEPPTLTEVADQVFHGFAKNLPEPSKS